MENVNEKRFEDLKPGDWFYQLHDKERYYMKVYCHYVDGSKQKQVNECVNCTDLSTGFLLYFPTSTVVIVEDFEDEST